MQSALTGHIDRTEWRWVTGISIGLLILLFSPFIILALLNPPDEDWQFVGALHDYQDTAAHLSRIQQGANGDLLVEFMHTSERHDGLLIHPIYPLLGQLSRVTIQSPTVVFHIFRLIAALFMFLSIYQLGASIWTRTRTRRIFFILATMGAGFGWLYALATSLTGDGIVPDIDLPQISPLFSAGVNINYPIATACLALLAAVIVRIFRPGNLTEPNIDNGGTIAFLSSLTLAFVYPDALLPLNTAYLLCMLTHWGLRRKIFIEELRWWLWIIVPALPVITYNLIIAMNNEIVQMWLIQRGQATPSPILLMIGVAIPLVIGLPSLWRAVRRFEADGDRFMLLWLLAMLILTYLPLVLNQYFLLGLMLPLAYFATRAVEDVWMSVIRRRYRGIAYAIAVVMLLPSHVMWLFLPVIPILQGWSNVSGNVLEQSYTVTFGWLSDNVQSEDVILSSPEVGAWIPYWVQAHPVYGHPDETINADVKFNEVVEWYKSTTSDAAICERVVIKYNVQLVLVGSRERLYGDNACVQNLVQIATFGDVDIYVTNNARILQD